MPSDSVLDADVNDVVDDTEDDSDWSAHRGEEVGWSTARNRRNRVSANRTRGRRSQNDNTNQVLSSIVISVPSDFMYVEVNLTVLKNDRN